MLIGIGTCQRLVTQHLGTSMIILLSLMTVNLSLPNVQKQSASQSTGFDNRFFFILVKTWNFFPFDGRGLISSIFVIAFHYYLHRLYWAVCVLLFFLGNLHWRSVQSLRYLDGHGLLVSDQWLYSLLLLHSLYLSLLYSEKV